jgi:simple sugar transport system permease protein
MTETGFLTVILAVLGSAIRGSTPFLFVSLGECLTEKSGRINLGQEGILILGAMVGYAASYETDSAWLGVAAAGAAGAALALCHALACQLRRVNDVAVGVALIMFGTGIAFLFGKPFIQPAAPMLPALPLGWWASDPAVRAALQVNALFLLGIALAIGMHLLFRRTRWGLILRTVGGNAEAARALGFRVDRVRLIATAVGGFLSGMGGSFLSLYYPGSWTESLSNGQGLIAVALVIFARWEPLRCLLAALMFGGAQAIGPALQAIGLSQAFYLVSALPFVLTLVIMAVTCAPGRRAAGAPGELKIA